MSEEQARRIERLIDEHPPSYALRRYDAAQDTWYVAAYAWCVEANGRAGYEKQRIDSAKQAYDWLGY